MKVLLHIYGGTLWREGSNLTVWASFQLFNFVVVYSACYISTTKSTPWRFPEITLRFYFLFQAIMDNARFAERRVFLYACIGLNEKQSWNEFWKETVSCFCCSPVHVVQKHDCDPDNLSYISDVKSSFIRGAAMEAVCLHRWLWIPATIGGQVDQE